MAFFKPIYYEPKARYYDIILRFDAWEGDVLIIPNATFKEGLQMAATTIKDYGQLFEKLKVLEKKKAIQLKKLKQEPELHKVKPL